MLGTPLGVLGTTLGVLGSVAGVVGTSVSTTVDDQVLDEEGAGEAASFPRARTAPVPSRLLIEHDVTETSTLSPRGS